MTQLCAKVSKLAFVYLSHAHYDTKNHIHCLPISRTIDRVKPVVQKQVRKVVISAAHL